MLTTRNLVNINVALDPTIINNFNNGVINYYSNAPDCYYAKLCATCNIVKVSKGNNTYVDQPCATCPVETLQCPGYNTLKTVPHGTNGTAAVCSYQPAVCVTCQTAPPAPPPPVLTTVAIHCPTCPVPVTSQTITCPTSVASSVVSIASVSGAVVAQSVAVVAQSVAQQAVAITVTAASVVATPAPSTVVNAVCTTCPAGSQAVTVAQVTPVAAPTPASPGSPGTPGTPGSPASPGTPGTPGTPAAAGNVSTGTGMAICRSFPQKELIADTCNKQARPQPTSLAPPPLSSPPSSASSSVLWHLLSCTCKFTQEGTLVGGPDCGFWDNPYSQDVLHHKLGSFELFRVCLDRRDRTPVFAWGVNMMLLPILLTFNNDVWSSR